MPTRWLLPAALLTVWIVWGSTYYAIRVALESIPPFAMTAARMTIAGLVLLGIGRIRGLRMPTRSEWLACARIGVLLFCGGTGSVVYAEQTVSSGLVAVLVAPVPVYTAAIGMLYGSAVSRRQWAGILVGVAGVLVLNAGGELQGNLGTTILLAAGSAAWALGSVQTHVLPMPPGAMGSGAQMLAGGLALGVMSLLTGETLAGPITADSAAAVVYLIVFGSLLAFTAYGWLLKNAPLPLATSYAYVNPVVAVLLGGWLGAERLGAAGWAGLAIVLVGVGLVTRGPVDARGAATTR